MQNGEKHDEEVRKSLILLIYGATCKLWSFTIGQQPFWTYGLLTFTYCLVCTRNYSVLSTCCIKQGQAADTIFSTCFDRLEVYRSPEFKCRHPVWPDKSSIYIYIHTSALWPHWYPSFLQCQSVWQQSGSSTKCDRATKSKAIKLWSAASLSTQF